MPRPTTIQLGPYRSVLQKNFQTPRLPKRWHFFLTNHAIVIEMLFWHYDNLM